MRFAPEFVVTQRNNSFVGFCAGVTIWFFCFDLFGYNSADELSEQVRQLQRQNEALSEQMRHQQALIESLTGRVNELQKSATAQNAPQPDRGAISQTGVNLAAASSTLGKVMLSGEGGVAFFNSGSHGSAPNAEFHVDEAKVFLEGPIWGEVYFFTEINLLTHEAVDVNLNLGECYLDFEHVSRLWSNDRMLNVRLGRLDIPFGEEYLSRDAIDNPLISHSLTDFWGVDEGIELYGGIGKFNYVMAVQNGGLSDVKDFDRDKSIAGRIGFDPNRHLHLSVSGMRTGDIDTAGDPWSAMWFGGAFIRPLDATYTTKFHADLVQGDAVVRLPRVTIRTFGGFLHYDDNDSLQDNRRDVYYYSVEGVGEITHKLYGAARFSQIFADKGFPILANGQFGEFFLSGKLTEEIWRMTLGLGYRWSDNLVGKLEYNFEQGRVTGGGSRNHEDLFAIELAFKF
jgi:hypothetical protein